MGFSILSALILICIVTNYFACIRYLRGLRGEYDDKKMKDYSLILTSIFWGSPIILILYCVFKEIRDEDHVHKYRLLILEILLFVIEAVGVFLLIYFKVVTLDPVTVKEILFLN